MSSLVERTEQMREEWVTELERIVTKISANFSNFISRIGCSGEVIVDNSEGEVSDFSLEYGLSVPDKQSLLDYHAYKWHKNFCEVTGEIFSSGNFKKELLLLIMLLLHLDTLRGNTFLHGNIAGQLRPVRHWNQRHVPKVYWNATPDYRFSLWRRAVCVDDALHFIPSGALSSPFRLCGRDKSR